MEISEQVKVTEEITIQKGYAKIVMMEDIRTRDYSGRGYCFYNEHGTKVLAIPIEACLYHFDDLVTKV